MLPLVTASWAVVDLVAVRVPVKIVVVIDVDITPAPVAIAPPVIRDPGAKDDAGAERQSHPWIIAGITIGIVGIRRRTVDNRRIVGRNINGLWIRLLDNYDLLVVGGFSLDRLF